MIAARMQLEESPVGRADHLEEVTLERARRLAGS